MPGKRGKVDKESNQNTYFTLLGNDNNVTLYKKYKEKMAALFHSMGENLRKNGKFQNLRKSHPKGTLKPC